MIDMCTDTCDVCTDKINDSTDTCDNECTDTCDNDWASRLMAQVTLGSQLAHIHCILKVRSGSTFCLLVLSADNLCKQSGPRSDPIKLWY